MKVFLTGATGYIGSVVAEKLHAAGHNVLGLARSDSASAKLRSCGVEPFRGDLRDLQRLQEGAQHADAVISLGHVLDDFNDLSAYFAALGKVIDTFAEVLEGTQKPLIFSSGAMVLTDQAGGEPSDKVIYENTPFTPSAFMAGMATNEQATLQLSSRGIHSIVLRMPAVYGRGGSVLIPMLMKLTPKYNATPYVGKGENRWAWVHVDDLAELFVLALERAPAGSLFNAGAEEHSMKIVAESISRNLGFDGKTVSLSAEEAGQAEGEYFRIAIGSNSRASGRKARELLGWQPKAISLLEDIEHGSYH